jgi:flavorubredoxin
VKLLEAAPQIKVLASPSGKIYLGPITNNTGLRITAVKDGEALDIGGGRR